MPSPKFNEHEANVYSGLKAAYDLHESLGKDGVTAVEPNRFGDTAMVADIGAERVMVEVLDKAGVNAEVHSEELGVFDLPNDGPRRLIVTDGLDGSSVYKRARGQELYGSMLALFENDDPLYDDYLAAGIALHSLHLALVAGRQNGLQVVDLRTNQLADNPITPGNRAFVDDGQVDESHVLYPYFKVNKDVHGDPLRAAGYNTEFTGSSAAYYALQALGGAKLVGEATRKGNLEFAAAYAVVTEADGVMIDVATGTSIGDQRFKTYGQKEHVPIISVRSSAEADEILAIIDRTVPAPKQR